MSPAEVLADAAALAARQPTVTTAIREALIFADHWLPGRCVLGDEPGNPAHVLARSCARPADVAAVFASAARRAA